LTYESEDFCFASPVRERRASARERLLSYREPASRNPQDVHTETRLGNPHARAPFRLLSIRAPRQAVLRTSSWLAPSSSTRPCDRTGEKTRDATDRYLPPIRTTCTRTSRVSSSLSPVSRWGTPHGVLGSVTLAGGPDVSRHPRPLRRTMNRLLLSNPLPFGLLERAWAFSSHGAGTVEPLTPLSRPLLLPPPRPPSWTLQPGLRARLLISLDGSEDAAAAETTRDAAS
jgi:hypothetical protein